MKNDTQLSNFVPRASPGTLEYKLKVAEPTMAAIDAMPAQWRELVHEFGYIDVYRAWRRGWVPARVRAAARDGVFTLREFNW